MDRTKDGPRGAPVGTVYYIERGFSMVRPIIGEEFRDWYAICAEVEDEHSLLHRTDVGKFLEIPTGRAASCGGQFVASSYEDALKKALSLSPG